MSKYTCSIPTQSYFDFKIEYFKRFPSSTYRIGQMFLARFVAKDEDYFDYDKLWNEECLVEAETMMYDVILKMDWDLMSLIPVRKV